MSRLQCTYRQAHSAAQKKIGKARRAGEWQYEYWLDGKFQFKVTIPDEHGRASEQIPIGTLKRIMSQLKLSREQFFLWRDCPIDAEQYEQIIRQQLNL